jgi:hypothetical protein
VQSVSVYIQQMLCRNEKRKYSKSRTMRSLCCLCVCVCIHHIVARKRLGKHVPMARNTHTTTEEIARHVVFYAVRITSKGGKKVNIHLPNDQPTKFLV